MTVENENSNETTNDTAEATGEETIVETQSTETQSSEQADTTDTVATLNDSMGIQEKEETSEIESSEPSLDDIVAEAMAGELSEETQKLVDQNGMSKHLEMLVQGHRAIQEKNNNEVFDVVGGKESYGELQEWGKDNMSKEEQEAFNSALFSGNMHMAKLAVQGLQSRYVTANGKGPERVLEGGGGHAAENSPFSNVGEYLKVTQTQKYKRDPEYRASIEGKRNKSGF